MAPCASRIDKSGTNIYIIYSLSIIYTNITDNEAIKSPMLYTKIQP